MNGDSSLVVTLVDRLTTRASFPHPAPPPNTDSFPIQLPHRTGSPLHDFNRDEIVVLTRATLVGVSASCIGIVAETLVQLLEELAKPYKVIQSHPIHILHSEIYIVELLADCFSTHWASVNTSRLGKRRHHVQNSDSESSGSENSSKNMVPPDAHYGQKRRASRNKLLARNTAPDALADDLVKRLIDAIKLFSRPVSESYVLPASNILDDVFKGIPGGDGSGLESAESANGHLNGADVSKLLLDKSDAIEAYTRGIL
jgi:neurofibromin 1